MNKFKGIGNYVVFTLLAISIISLADYAGMFAVENQSSVYPSWRFVHGCSDGECSSSMYNLGEILILSENPFYDKNAEGCSPSNRIISNSDKPECFSINFTVKNASFAGEVQNFLLKDGDKININPYVSIKWNIGNSIIINGESCHNICSGSGEDRDCNKECRNLNYEYDWIEPQYENIYTFNIIAPFLETTILDFHIVNNITEDSYINYKIENKLTTIDGGAVIREKSTLFSPDKSIKEENFKVTKPESTHKSELSLDGLGDKNIREQSFVTVVESIHNFKSNIRIYDIEKTVTSRTLPNIVLPNETESTSEDNETIHKELIDEEKDLKSLYVAVLLSIIAGITLWQINKKP